MCPWQGWDGSALSRPMAVGQAARTRGGGGKGLLVRSWCQADQPRMEKGSTGTAFPGVLGMYPPLRGGRWGVTWQEGSAWWILATMSAGCPCTGHPSPSASVLLAREGLASLGLSLHHTPCPSPTARQREALEPAGPWGDTEQPGFAPGFAPGSALPSSSTLRLQREDISAPSLCRNHQWYKNLFKTEGK